MKESAHPSPGLETLVLGLADWKILKICILTIVFHFRFYFVGDEDLLEIIGNSKNVAKLQKHFKKMFAGVASILLNEDNTEVLGISSREGEEVRIELNLIVIF